MGERLRHHAALGLLLQAVVADRRRGAERLFQVTLLEDLTGAVGADWWDDPKIVSSSSRTDRSLA